MRRNRFAAPKSRAASLHVPTPAPLPGGEGTVEGGFGATGGEVAILYFGIAGIIGVLGSRKYGLEQLLFKRELL